MYPAYRIDQLPPGGTVGQGSIPLLPTHNFSLLFCSFIILLIICNYYKFFTFMEKLIVVSRYMALLAAIILVPGYSGAAETLSERDRLGIAEEIAKINDGLPKMVDKVTRWEAIAAVGPTVSYVFTLLNYTKENAPPNIGYYLYTQALDGYCAAGGYVSHLKDYKVNLSLYYRDVNGNIIASLMINHEDCREEAAKEDTIVKEPELGDTINVDPEWLSLSDQLFAETIEVWPDLDNLHERLLGKWQNEEAPVVHQFLSNGEAHQIDGNKIKFLRYSVSQINKEKRIMLVRIKDSVDSAYDLYIQFYPLDQRARVAIVKDGNKSIERWKYIARPDLIAIASQYSHGKKPWVSWDQILASREYEYLGAADRSSLRKNWQQLFGNNKQY